MSDRTYAGISATVEAIRETLPPNPPHIALAAHAALDLLGAFLEDIRTIADAHRPELRTAEAQPDLTEDAIIEAFRSKRTRTGQAWPTTAELEARGLKIERDPSTGAYWIRNATPGPATVADPLPPGHTQKLAAELIELGCAETEGKFMDKVVDNLETIILALEAYNPPNGPEPGDGSMLAKPKPGTEPFNSPVSQPPEIKDPNTYWPRGPKGVDRAADHPAGQCEHPGCSRPITVTPDVNADRYLCPEHYAEHIAKSMPQVDAAKAPDFADTPPDGVCPTCGYAPDQVRPEGFACSTCG